MRLYDKTVPTVGEKQPTSRKMMLREKSYSRTYRYPHSCGNSLRISFIFCRKDTTMVNNHRYYTPHGVVNVISQLKNCRLNNSIPLRRQIVCHAENFLSFMALAPTNRHCSMALRNPGNAASMVSRFTQYEMRIYPSPSNALPGVTSILSCLSLFTNATSVSFILALPSDVDKNLGTLTQR